jgi:hypothetical protein
MGTLFTLTPAIKSVTQQALEDLITELGKNCKLFYPPTQETCGCAGNVWLTGGPAPPGDVTTCPLCGGSGFRAKEVSETLKMGVAVHPKDFWKKPPPNIQIPDGTIQTKGYLTDLPKLRAAERMQLQPELDAVARWMYVRDDDPVDVSNIVQGVFVVLQWKRAP